MNNLKIKKVELPKKYIFVPLQVNMDTQIVVHSNFRNMQEFIDLVEKTFYSLNSDFQLVFKVHPMEKGVVNYKFNKKSMVVDNDTKELIKNSEFLITINSTVGFEAIQEYKKVIVLGEAFYRIKDIVICSSINNFKKDLSCLLDSNTTLDKNLIDKFINYLKFEYQINGNLFNYDFSMIKEIEQKILKSTFMH